jgi:hypothetical protein
MITMTPETLEAYIQKARDEGFEKAWKQAGHLDLDLRQRDVQIAELKAENARYREALEIVAEGEAHPLRYYQLRDLAREALKGGHEQR